MLGGGALPARTPPAGRPLAGGGSRALRLSGAFRIIIGRGGSRPPAPPRAPLERFALSVVIKDEGSGGVPPPPHPTYWPAFGRREILERFGIRPPPCRVSISCGYI